MPQLKLQLTSSKINKCNTMRYQLYCFRYQIRLLTNHVVIQGESVLMRASYEGHADVVKALIEAGANVNLTDEVSNVMQGNHLGLYLTQCRKALE